MRKRTICGIATIVVLGILTSPLAAHYLWVTADSKTGENGTVNVYFEGGPSPGDGQYLDPFVNHGTTWIRTIDSPKPQKLAVADTKVKNKRWLSGKLTAKGPRSIDSYGKWGVYRYGKTDVLLHYYARLLDVSGDEELNKLSRAEQMNLDIVPTVKGETVAVSVLWKGKPVVGRPVYVRGPKGLSKNLKTDKDGKVSFTRTGAGRYTLRSLTEEKESGTDNEKDYTLIRHNGTIIFTLKGAG